MPKLGYLADPPKMPGQRPDFEAGEILRAAPTPPKVADLNRYIVDILDQGELSSCVANAILQAVRISHVKQGIVSPQLGSRLYGYYAARALDHTEDVDGGTYLRSFFTALLKFGFCPENVWPYDTKMVNVRPGMSADRAAYDQANPSEYRRIYESGDARLGVIKRAIASGFAVCFGTDVDSDFCSGLLAEPLLPPLKNIAGGHAMLVSGYDGDVFTVTNSWSKNWGNGGRCSFSGEYLTWEKTRDLWILNKAPNYSQPAGTT